MWRLEVLRMLRTRRLIALVAVFLILGLGEPILTYYLPEIIKHAGKNVQITMPKQTAYDSMVGFAGQIAELGTLVVMIVAAASLSFDARPGLAVFYRTRVRRPLMLILPRCVVVVAASIAALALGTIGAWYETTVLIGSVTPGAILAGAMLEALWLCFVVSVVAFFSSVIRGVLATVGSAVALFVVFNVVGSLSTASSWMPTRLAASAADLVQRPLGTMWHAVVVAVVATMLAFALAVNRFARRELESDTGPHLRRTTSALPHDS